MNKIVVKKMVIYLVYYSKTSIFALSNDRGVEQLVARWAHNPKVTSSSLVSATREGISKEIPFLFPPSFSV